MGRGPFLSIVTPNRLTCFRIMTAIACPIILLSERSVTNEMIAMAICTVGCLTDYWDGYLARKHSMVSSFGKIADPIADKMLILGCMVSFVAYGLYAIEFIIPILVREIMVTVTRFRRLSRGQVLPAEWAGKLKVLFQIGSLAMTFTYVIAYDSTLFFSNTPIFLFVLDSFHHIFILLAMIVTVASGVIFFRNLEDA